jgi:hypothetical protein
VFGPHRADESDLGAAFQENADHVGVPADLFVEQSLGRVRPDPAPESFGHGGEIRAKGIWVSCRFGELVGQGVGDPIILSCN